MSAQVPVDLAVAGYRGALHRLAKVLLHPDARGLDRRSLAPVTRLAEQLDVAHGTGAALTDGDDVVVLQTLSRPTGHASPLVAPPHLPFHL